MWHFVTKSTGLKSVKPSISGHFPESIDPAAVLIRPCVQNVPGKNGELSPSGYSLLYTHGKAGQSLSKGQVAWLHLRTCLVPSWCGASRTIWGILGPPRAASPVSLPKGKAGTKNRKMNECEGLHWTFVFMKLSFVCLPKLNVVFKQLSIFGRKLALLWKWGKGLNIERKMVLTP